jgi:hypothetical protein
VLLAGCDREAACLIGINWPGSIDGFNKHHMRLDLVFGCHWAWCIIVCQLPLDRHGLHIFELLA